MALSSEVRKTFDTGQAAPRSPFLLTPLDDGGEPEPVDWLIDDYLEVAATTLVYGHSGTLKSFIVLHMALCIVSGRPFFGRPVRKGSVILVAGEGRRGIRKRIRAWESAYGKLSSEERAALLCVTNGAGKTVTANVSDQAFMGKLSAAISDRAERPLLVIFDTVATTFGLTEETNEAISQALAVLRGALVDPFGCAVIAVHHTGKDGSKGPRGGYSFKCDSDASYLMARVAKNGREVEAESTDPFDWRHDRVRMLCKKMKDEEAPAPITFRANVEVVGQTEKGAIDSLALRLDEADLSETEAKVLKAWLGCPKEQWDTLRGTRPISRGTGIPHSTVDRIIKALREKGFLQS